MRAHYSDKLSLELQIARLTRALRSLSNDDLQALAPVLSGVGQEAVRVEQLRRIATAYGDETARSREEAQKLERLRSFA